MISVILLEPSVPGNIGAVARVMANFGFDNLVLVSPKCDHLSEESQGRSKHARSILRDAKVVHDIPKLDYLVATTSALGTDSNISRSPVSPKELVALVKGKLKGSIGLVFGPEGPGLTNAQIAKCDFVVTIPTHKSYHSMNISHAVAIVLYELFDAYGQAKVAEGIRPITPAERRVALKYIDDILEKYAFRTDTKRETQRLLWKKIVGKLFMSKRESYALLGFLRQILKGPK